ncbi:MAG TPA: RNA polymerase-binding protein DksA [Gammaproteobacteria bacterium]|nr:RNA polymerase-binding protein DksA [Gammaproteobacteria bacterium]
MAVAKKKTAQTKTVKKKATAKKAPARKKAAPKKATPKKKAAAKKAPAKKTPLKKAAPKKSAAKKKTAPKKSTKAAAPASRPARGSTLEVGAFVPYKEKKGEAYMNPRQMAHFRAILENWKKELLEEMERTVHHLQDEAANFPDPNDRASQESEFALELRTRDRERKLIKKIDESLAKLDSLDYGYCEVCGVEIGIRRLEARPTATLCIDCKTLDEIREKQSQG